MEITDGRDESTYRVSEIFYVPVSPTKTKIFIDMEKMT
jgi:hypothetical protein